MKASELRLDNFIFNSKGELERVYTLNVESINGYDGNAGIIPDDEKLFSGIPLTPEILKLLQFECYEIDNHKEYVIDGFKIITYVNGSVDYFWLGKYYNKKNKHIKYLHQLQNIYFDLTDKELMFGVKIDTKDLHKVAFIIQGIC